MRQYTLELERRNDDLNTFAHTVAHDLKNPLGILVGYTEVLKRDYTLLNEEEAQPLLNSIIHGGAR